jgi:hypothetical protein
VSSADSVATAPCEIISRLAGRFRYELIRGCPKLPFTNVERDND